MRKIKLLVVMLVLVSGNLLGQVFCARCDSMGYNRDTSYYLGFRDGKVIDSTPLLRFQSRWPVEDTTACLIWYSDTSAYKYRLVRLDMTLAYKNSYDYTVRWIRGYSVSSGSDVRYLDAGRLPLPEKFVVVLAKPIQ